MTTYYLRGRTLKDKLDALRETYERIASSLDPDHMYKLNDEDVALLDTRTGFISDPKIRQRFCNQFKR